MLPPPNNSLKCKVHAAVHVDTHLHNLHALSVSVPQERMPLPNLPNVPVARDKYSVQDEGGVADQGHCDPSRGSSAAGECLGKHQGTAAHLVSASAQQAVAQLPAGVQSERCIPDMPQT